MSNEEILALQLARVRWPELVNIPNDQFERMGLVIDLSGDWSDPPGISLIISYNPDEDVFLIKEHRYDDMEEFATDILSI